MLQGDSHLLVVSDETLIGVQGVDCPSHPELKAELEQSGSMAGVRDVMSKYPDWKRMPDTIVVDRIVYEFVKVHK